MRFKAVKKESTKVKTTNVRPWLVDVPLDHVK